MSLTLETDDELVEWVFGIIYGQPTEAGDFLKAVAQAAARADHENYPILRPALLELKAKYPKYRFVFGDRT